LSVEITMVKFTDGQGGHGYDIGHRHGRGHGHDHGQSPYPSLSP
jgi:hypothetical protein